MISKSFILARELTLATLAAFLFVASATAQFLPDPVENLGGGLAGVNGVPSMAASGMLSPGENVVFTLDNAAPNTTAVLVVGSSIANLPAFGGIIIPNPDVLINVTTDAVGHAETTIIWPQNLMDVTVFVQWTAVDSAAVQGRSISNALALTGKTWTVKNGSGTWGKLHQSVNKLTIKVTKADGTITTWAHKASTNYYEDGNGNKLTIGSGSPQPVTITGGSHAGAYTIS